MTTAPCPDRVVDGITGAQVRGLRMGPCIVFNGACYTGITGRLCESEDLAQQTFVIAWRELHQLREPTKLRPWLCSMARSVISRASRRQRRDPAQGTEPLEHV